MSSNRESKLAREVEFDLALQSPLADIIPWIMLSVLNTNTHTHTNTHNNSNDNNNDDDGDSERKLRGDGYVYDLDGGDDFMGVYLSPSSLSYIL